MNTVKRGLIELSLSSGGGVLQPVSLFQYVQECVGAFCGNWTYDRLWEQKRRRKASFFFLSQAFKRPSRALSGVRESSFV